MSKEEMMLDLWHELLDVGHAYRQIIQVMNAPTGLSGTALAAIVQLGRVEKMKMHDIAEYLGITLGAATSLINNLEKEAYIERHRCTDDRRIIYVQLTTEGRAKTKHICTNFGLEAQYMFRQLDEAQLTNLSASLATMKQLMTNYVEEKR